MQISSSNDLVPVTQQLFRSMLQKQRNLRRANQVIAIIFQHVTQSKFFDGWTIKLLSMNRAAKRLDFRRVLYNLPRFPLAQKNYLINVMEQSSKKRNVPFDDSIPEELDARNLESIEVDLHRTNTTEASYTAEGQQQLKRVLIAVVSKHRDIGYCQGMNFLVSVLLHMMNYDEGAAIKLFDYLLVSKDMRRIFESGLERLQELTAMLDKLIEAFVPDVHYKFAEEFGV